MTAQEERIGLSALVLVGRLGVVVRVWLGVRLMGAMSGGEDIWGQPITIGMLLPGNAWL